MENFQFDQLVEEIYKTIGKEDPFYRETVAVKRDLLNQLNQAVSFAIDLICYKELITRIFTKIKIKITFFRSPLII